MKAITPRIAAALCVVAALVPVAGDAQAAPVRVVDHAGVVLRRLEPQADGSLAVVTNTAVTRVVPGSGDGAWKTEKVAAVAGPRADTRIHAAAWSERGQWWLLCDDAQDGSHASWNHLIVGPIAVASGRRGVPAAARTLSRRGAPWELRTLARASDGAAWVGVITDERQVPGALHRFDVQGRDDEAFARNAALAVDSATVSDVVPGEPAGWWLATLANPGAHGGAAVLALAADGHARTAFGRAGRVELQEGAAVEALQEDAGGVLWILGWDRDAAGVHPWLRAWSASTGERHAEFDASPEIAASLWPAARSADGDWIGFVRNAAPATACAATRGRRAAPGVLRCVVHDGTGWHSLGEVDILPDLSVRDIIGDPRDPHRLIVGVDDVQDNASLLAWSP